MSPRHLSAFLALTLLVPRTSGEAADNSPISDPEGETLAAQLRLSKPVEDFEVQGVLEIRASDGRRSRLPVRFQTLVGKDRWSAVYEVLPGGGSPVQKLTIEHKPDQAPLYLLRQADPGANGFRKLSGEQAMVPFAGSDFWLADFGFEFLQWPQQRSLKIKNAMRKGRPCRVLESTNPQPTKDAYSRVVSWIDRETDGLILADAYGPDGKILKHFSIGSITKVNDRWELKNMEIRNEKTDSRTRIEFDFHTKHAVPAE